MTDDHDSPGNDDRDHQHGHDHQHDHEHRHDHNHADGHATTGPSAGQPLGADALMELQMIQQQLDEIQKVLEAADEQLKEIATMSENLDDLANVKPGTGILVPVVRGMFARAALTDITTLKVNVGANTLVDKSLPEAREMLESQMMEVAEYKDQMEGQRQQLIMRARHLGARITQQ